MTAGVGCKEGGDGHGEYGPWQTWAMCEAVNLNRAEESMPPLVNSIIDRSLYLTSWLRLPMAYSWSTFMGPPSERGNGSAGLGHKSFSSYLLQMQGVVTTPAISV